MNEFWRRTKKKVLWTMAEAALAIIGSAQLLQDVNWPLVLSAVLMAGIITILKCIVFDMGEVESAYELTDEDVAEHMENEDDVE